MRFIDYGNNGIIGDDKIAENSYFWSLKNKVGTSYKKSFSCGLDVTAVADSTEPKIIYQFNLAKFKNFIKFSGNPSKIVLCYYGVEVTFENEEVTIRLLDADGQTVLFSSKGKTDTLHEVCMVRLSEEGPYLHEPKEYTAVDSIKTEAFVTGVTRTLSSMKESPQQIKINTIKEKIRLLSNER